MTWNEVKRWTNTRVENRGDDYRAFKQEKAEKLLALLEIDFPGIKKAVKFWYTSTPLTYRDYTGTWEGSVYGMLKDFNNPMKTLLLPRTRISNLLLTGQNMNIHGVVGVTIGSFLTCAELLGSDYLIEKFRNAG
jgi:all-trans-retinol 13,14-reductase